MLLKKIVVTMRNKYIIGIDPDAEKSGIAILDTETKEIELFTKSFPETIAFLKWFNENYNDFIIVIEAGWMVKKSNFHKFHGQVGERIAAKVGANHETGKKIVEMMNYYNIPIQEIHPLKKMWNGKDGKITHEEISKFINMPKQSNQEVRDAALIAWNIAWFTIKI